jgi:hypothetical protein
LTTLVISGTASMMAASIRWLSVTVAIAPGRSRDVGKRLWRRRDRSTGRSIERGIRALRHRDFPDQGDEQQILR